jgi:hypothetical protein
MSHLYKQAKVCGCGYTTLNRGSWSLHTNKRCKLVKEQITQGENSRITSLEKDKDDLKQQLEAKDQQMKEQLTAKDEHYQRELAAKDEQIKELIKRPRVVNNTTNNYVDASINCYGKESLDHITPQQIQALLSNPSTAVPELIKLKHKRVASNRNVRCPNKKRGTYQVVVPDGEGNKQWENRPKGDVLEDLYDANASHLEAEADEETRAGLTFLNHQDKVKESIGSEASDGGRLYHNQLDKIHCVITS